MLATYSNKSDAKEYCLSVLIRVLRFYFCAHLLRFGVKAPDV